MKYQSRYKFFNPNQIVTYPIGFRKNKVHIEDLMDPKEARETAFSVDESTLANIEAVAGTSTIRSRKGPCVLIENAVRLEILNTYFCGDSSVVNPYEYPRETELSDGWSLR